MTSSAGPLATDRGGEGGEDGHLEHVQGERPSGTPILDEAALVAVKLAQPFPPVPDSMCKRTLGLRVDCSMN